MSQPSEEELFNAVKESLDKEGRLGTLKAELRAAVLSILHTRQPNKEDFGEVPEETRMINELLREYLIWNGYTHTEKHLSLESGAEKGIPSKENITSDLGIIHRHSKSEVPLLYYIISAFQNHDDE
ncbi:hypothetical protein RI129_009458 [Pyrocoelia pectoralis]|uniref:FGFR1 oncogene partner (FOP) N-terminal dimerisation domain-containing protein n=1 Tax=Pyrocoelia pectoralis TaxID=417401 RepID=A0AAN7ZHX2_9COLE